MKREMTKGEKQGAVCVLIGIPLVLAGLGGIDWRLAVIVAGLLFIGTGCRAIQDK